MEKSEREILIVHLENTREQLRAAIQDITPEQEQYREAENRWSIQNCLEHIIAVENTVMGRIQKAAAAPLGALSGEEQKLKDVKLLSGVTDRSRRVEGPAHVMPTRSHVPVEALWKEFEAARERTIAIARDMAELRFPVGPHMIFGELDAYQWLLLIGSHGQRHLLQMEEVRSTPQYPAATS